MHRFFEFCVKRPRSVIGLMGLLTASLFLLAALPSVWPETFTMLHPAKVDTDPENMLPAEEPVRVFHNAMKREMNLHDMLVVGVVNESNPEGVFNVDSLQNISDLATYAKTLNWADEKTPSKQAGVIEVDLIAPSTVDSLEPGEGSIRFGWLMPSPPSTQEEALAIRKKAMRIPFLRDTVISGNGRALALYIPLTDKHLSYKIASLLQERIDSYKGDDHFHITGLPVAEDTFGVEMFIQMGISAPVAMLVIFILMWIFFRNISLILSPMILAVVCVIQTMGLLIATGHTVHIMSSMIPIFIMPIAVLDAIHILSDFFDRYQETRNRETTIVSVMETLFMPMLYTSLTTAVGFASLALTPIPPVQVFGLFIAFGVMMAWVWTVSFIPASVMLIPEHWLKNFGLTPKNAEEEAHGWMSRFLHGVGTVTTHHAKLVLLITILLCVGAAYGISKIRINDNPIKWFEPSHPIRVADAELNKHFAGTYMAYLALEPKANDKTPFAPEFQERLEKRTERLIKDGYDSAAEIGKQIRSEFEKKKAEPKDALLQTLSVFINTQLDSAPNTTYDTWDAFSLFLSEEKQRDQIFKDPTVLRYMEALQEHLLTTGVVGKSSSLADLVKTVYRDLYGGQEEYYRIPDNRRQVAGSILQYENSHRPHDLWHFVTPDYRKASLWVQLKSGDNRDMEHVIRAVDAFVEQTPPPEGLQHRWFGLTYINVIWQEKMVNGMLEAFLGSFVAVLFMMIILFRSALWGILSMIPLTITISMIYGLIGLIGKDYDMPVAVLSSLSLGLAVDYAIHFLARSRELTKKHGSWKEAVEDLFGEPARAITRNVLVVGIGFLPLLLAPLVPYQTVGILIAAILIAAGVATLILLPALQTLLQQYIFSTELERPIHCRCKTCIFIGITAIAMIAINVYTFMDVGITHLTWFSIGLFFILAGICATLSRRESCALPPEDKETPNE